MAWRKKENWLRRGMNAAQDYEALGSLRGILLLTNSDDCQEMQLS